MSLIGSAQSFKYSYKINNMDILFLANDIQVNSLLDNRFNI